MSIRFQADNDLNRLIVAATFRREPAIDFQTAQYAQLDYLDDKPCQAGIPSGHIRMPEWSYGLFSVSHREPCRKEVLW